MRDVWDDREKIDYLGDGVYAAYDGYSIRLRANDYRNADSEIYLEPQVIDALLRFKERMEAER